jgi:hypothetical protein
VRAQLDVFAGVVDGGGHRFFHQLHFVEAGALGRIDQCGTAHAGPAHGVGDDAAHWVRALAQPTLGHDHAHHRCGRIARVDGLATEQQRRRCTERAFRRALQAIGVHARQVVGGGADDELALGGAQHHGGNPAVAFDLQRRHGGRHDRRGRLAGGAIGGQTTRVQLTHRTGRA